MLNNDTKERITINIDSNEDKILYKNILDSKWPFKNNLELFTMAALIGKYELNEKKPINKSVSYIRVKDNISKDDMIIIKSLAISDKNDVKIINDEDEMFKVSEQYARTGIKQINEWFDSKTVDLETQLARILIKKFNENKELD